MKTPTLKQRFDILRLSCEFDTFDRLMKKHRGMIFVKSMAEHVVRLRLIEEWVRSECSDAVFEKIQTECWRR